MKGSRWAVHLVGSGVLTLFPESREVPTEATPALIYRQGTSTLGLEIHVLQMAKAIGVLVWF